MEERLSTSPPKADSSTEEGDMPSRKASAVEEGNQNKSERRAKLA
jgi:hypothetical protein